MAGTSWEAVIISTTRVEVQNPPADPVDTAASAVATFSVSQTADRAWVAIAVTANPSIFSSAPSILVA